MSSTRQSICFRHVRTRRPVFVFSHLLDGFVLDGLAVLDGFVLDVYLSVLDTLKASNLDLEDV